MPLTTVAGARVLARGATPKQKHGALKGGVGRLGPCVHVSDEHLQLYTAVFNIWVVGASRVGVCGAGGWAGRSIIYCEYIQLYTTRHTPDSSLEGPTSKLYL